MTSLSSRDAPASAEAGFSLVEMLVVLAILGLATAIAAPALLDPSGARAVKRSAAEAAALLRRAGAEAALSGADAVVEIDLKARELSASWGGNPVRLPAAMDLQAVSAREATLTAGHAAFRFFPDGGSTGGELRLKLKTAEARIGVDWLTGQVSRGEGP